MSAVDSDDLKALGFFGADVAGAAAMLVILNPLAAVPPAPPLWYVPVSAFVVSALLLMVSLRKRRFPTGPSPLLVYFSEGDTPVLDAVTSLVQTRAGVQRIRNSWLRRAPYLASQLLLVAGGALSGLELFRVAWFHG